MLTTAVAGVCFVLLASLGVWQLQRLEWKRAILAALQSSLASPAKPWDTAEPVPPDYAHVAVQGTLHADRPLLLYGRTLNGTPGVHVFSLLTRPGKPSVLIDRGFAATPLVNTALDAVELPNTTVEGLIRPVTLKAWFEMDNVPDRNRWFWIDPLAMARAAGVPGTIPKAYVEAIRPTGLGPTGLGPTGPGPTGPGSYGPVPTGGTLLSTIRNEHLNYAVTWFSFAAMLAGTYIVWLRRAIRVRP